MLPNFIIRNVNCLLGERRFDTKRQSRILPKDSNRIKIACLIFARSKLSLGRVFNMLHFNTMNFSAAFWRNGENRVTLQLKMAKAFIN